MQGKMKPPRYEVSSPQRREQLLVDSSTAQIRPFVIGEAKTATVQLKGQ
jgi:hypothetical protein